MRPKVIMSNLMSLDGSLTGFHADIGKYYSQLLALQPDMVLVGSQTVLAAHDDIPPEEQGDRRKPEFSMDDQRPYWVIVDSKGILQGLLHFYRRMEYTKDIIILASEKTPEGYISYLNDREYDAIITGSEHVNLGEACEILRSRYGAETLVTDTGGTLNSVLLDAGLVDELSIIIAPVLVGRREPALYTSKTGQGTATQLRLKRYEDLGAGYLHLLYDVTGGR